MIKTFGKIFHACCIIIFFIYWTVVFMLALPPQYKITSLNASLIKTMFSSWRLFSPPYTCHTRLYFIVRDRDGKGRTDTIEVLEKLAVQKQSRAPFNQKENIIDHLVNNNVSGLLRTVWEYKKIPGESLNSIMDSTYAPIVIPNTYTNRNYKLYMATLENYCKVILKDHKLKETGKELKIMISKKMMRPFNELNNVHYIQREILIFESPFKALMP